MTCIETEISATTVGVFYYPTDTGMKRSDGVKYQIIGGEVQAEKLGWEKEPVKRYYVTQLGTELMEFTTTPIPKESPLVVDWVNKTTIVAVEINSGMDNYTMANKGVFNNTHTFVVLIVFVTIATVFVTCILR